MHLKQYQADALAVLRRFFEEARMAGPKNAYQTITTDRSSGKRREIALGDGLRPGKRTRSARLQSTYSVESCVPMTTP